MKFRLIGEYFGPLAGLPDAKSGREGDRDIGTVARRQNVLFQWRFGASAAGLDLVYVELFRTTVAKSERMLDSRLHRDKSEVKGRTGGAFIIADNDRRIGAVEILGGNKSAEKRYDQSKRKVKSQHSILYH